MSDKPSATPNLTLPPAKSLASLPPGFLWGVSTSSYQIEGATQEDGRGDSIWDAFCRKRGRVANDDTGDVACDHYHRYADDVALMKTLGLAAYRFSVAWPRVLPRGRGAVNEAGLDFYDRLIDTLLKTGIEPWLCLYHWDLPQSLDELGGWQNRDMAGWFADYTALVARRYGDRVKRLATFNEPNVFTILGYGFGWHAPGLADRTAFLKAVHHVNLAHGAAVEVMRDLVPGASIGAVYSCQPCRPENDAPENKAAAKTFDELWNGAFPDPQNLALYPPELARAIEPYQRPGDMARIAKPLDWFGLNHYSPNYCKADPGNALGIMFGAAPENMPKTGIGWPIDADALRITLLHLARRYRLPIYITENGIGAYDKPNDKGEVVDQHRIDYLRDYLIAMCAAIAEGADVRGYLLWSLLDNFEWAAGYGQRFGMVYVDYKTQARTPKASCRWYTDLIAATRKAVPKSGR